jgi:hypothetical protein
MTGSNQTLDRYLLGELAEAEQTALEEKYFADSQLFDQLVAAENELTDKYARGQLPRRTRQQFERYYLAHPRLLERARFAQALTAHIDHLNQANRLTSSVEPRWSRLWNSIRGPKLAWGLALALLLLVAGVGWLAIQNRRLRQDIARSETERARQEEVERLREQHLPRNESAGIKRRASWIALDQVNPALSPTPLPASLPAFATLILNVSGIRGAEIRNPPTLNLPYGTENARIELNLRDVNYTGYSVIIHSADGREIFRHDGLKSTGKTRVSLALVVPANRFASGDYILTLKGVTQNGEVEDVSKSFFRVNQTRKP